MKPNPLGWAGAIAGLAVICSISLIVAAEQAPAPIPEQAKPAPTVRLVSSGIPDKPVDFQREVRQILSDNCFQCHGPDQSTRRAGLRLDLQEAALAQRQNGAPIVPGKPDQSLLYQKITSEDPAKRMPPASTHKTLTDAQKDILRRWIAQGADWKQHWAFVTPIRPPVPPVKNSSWVRNPIDQFVLAKMEEAVLAPNPPLDRRALIRRVSLDLTGLPPTIEEVDAFVADKSAGAYKKVVQRLLGSPHYGEHRARYWLDAARYGDTNGLHYDNYRGGIWPYRDWVVKALNNNLPFDKFTVEQIAGDLLPNPTVDQMIATGFARNNETTSENGVIEAEQKHNYIKDRADTTGTVFLGLTVECATCHDHKFDPISQRDHYAMEAFFNNTNERVMDNNRPDAPPIVFVPKDEDGSRWSEVRGQLNTITRQLETAQRAESEAFDRWLGSRKIEELPTALAGAQVLSLSSNVLGPHLSQGGVVGDLGLSPGVSLNENSPWPGMRSLKFTGAQLTLPRVDFIAGDEPFSVAAWVYLPKITLHPGLTGESGMAVISQMGRNSDSPRGPSRRVVTPAKAATPPDGSISALPPVVEVDDAEAPGDAGGNGWAIEIDEGVPALRLAGGDGKIMRARAFYNQQIKEAAWAHLTFTYDGSRKEEGLALYLNGKRFPIERGGFGRQGSNIVRELKGTLKSTAPLLLGSPPTLGSTPSGSNPVFDGSLAELRIFNRVITEEEARLVAAISLIQSAATKTSETLSATERDSLKTYFLYTNDAQYQRLLTDLNRLNAELKAMEDRADTAMVMEERKDSKAVAPLLFRGMYDQPRDLLEAQTPSALPPMAASLPRNRLGLAQWLVDPGNPLLSRVTINRFWREFFGVGIVKTVGDFGAQGDTPSHPELLDWLAVEFRESGWDMKKMAELIVTSATYQQSGVIVDAKLKKDPDNRLLSRGPRFRLDGEVVRDAALAASGLLVPKLGGPPVKPYQPAGVWEGTSMADSNTKHYKQDQGDSVYRRSIYTLWKRSAPPASMVIFDAPAREVCVVQRERTNTPLQALATMNDPQFIEAARSLAQQALRASPRKLYSQIDFMTSRVLARKFVAKERNIVTHAYEEFLKYYQGNVADAQKLLAVGESRADQTLPVAEFAALTMVANQLLNLDETLNK